MQIQNSTQKNDLRSCINECFSFKSIPMTINALVPVLPCVPEDPSCCSLIARSKSIKNDRQEGLSSFSFSTLPSTSCGYGTERSPRGGATPESHSQWLQGKGGTGEDEGRRRWGGRVGGGFQSAERARERYRGWKRSVGNHAVRASPLSDYFPPRPSSGSIPA